MTGGIEAIYPLGVSSLARGGATPRLPTHASHRVGSWVEDAHMTHFFADTETELMSPKSVIPEPVCMLVVCGDEQEIVAPGHNRQEWDEFCDLMTDPGEGNVTVWHNAAFDNSVLCTHNPDLFPQTFKSYREGRIHCTIVREKLYQLASTGDMDFYTLPDGSSKKHGYSLADLEQLYLGIDSSGDKKDSQSWRYRFSELKNRPLVNWPTQAIEYVLQDADSLRPIYEAQEENNQSLVDIRKINAWGCNGDNAVLTHRCTLAFCLQLIGSHGMALDARKVKELEDYLASELTPESMDLLIEKGILIPAKPAMPFANGATDKDGKVRMKKAQPEKVSKKALEAHVEALAAKNPGVVIKRSKKTQKVSVDAAWLAEYAIFCRVLQQYAHRAKFQQLAKTEVPRMYWGDEVAERIHPQFDFCKETGRTSSYGSKNYPSTNLQNINAKVRECYRAPEGRAYLSIDYEGMELGTVAQYCYDNYPVSVHRDLINAGVNIHTYLGAQLAYYLDKDVREACESKSIYEPMAIYDIFAEFKGSGDKAMEAFFKRYRTFAKPTDLGFPGGLREKTFIEYAKATYGVDLVDITGSYEGAKELAGQLRQVWLDTFPEMEMYFRDMEGDKFVDYNNGGHEYKEFDNDDGTKSRRKSKIYCYTTPMGMHRAKTTYNACANGMILQSPSAEGATLALIEVVQDCYDPTRGSVLYGKAKVCNFVHDEIIADVPLDGNERAYSDAITKRMIDAMSIATPNVQPRAEPALMQVWSKAAEEITGPNNELLLWEPEQK